MDAQPSITRHSWCGDAERALSFDSDLGVIKQEVLENIAELWRCELGEYHAWVVTRIDDQTLVIVSGQGKGFFQFMPHFVVYARSHGLGIRTHVTRPGLIRMWSRLGVTFDHYVLQG